MEELLACRVCLVTDAKFFNMFSYQLVAAYEIVSGTSVSTSDGLPYYICSFCTSLLMKFTTFQTKCRNSQALLNCAMLQQNLITTEYIRNIDRDAHNLNFPYTLSAIKDLDIQDHTNSRIIKEETEEPTTPDFDDIYEEPKTIKSESDEEPLSNIVKKKKSKKKKKIKCELDMRFDFDNVDSNDIKDIDVELRDDIDVIILTKQQQIDEVLARKNSQNYLNSFYKCELCYKGFMTDVTYKNHMAKHDPTYGSYECEICKVRCECGRALRTHMLNAHERQYVCRLCDHVAKCSFRAKEHYKWHYGLVYVCDICGATFSKSTSHLTHMRLQHPSGNACDICGDSFLGEYGLKMHKKRAHRNVEVSKLKSVFQCTSCGVQFRSIEALDTHMKASKDTSCSSFRSCVYCGCNFTTSLLLKEHLKEHQKDEEVKCVECGRKFAHTRTYAVHYQRFHLANGAGTGKGIRRPSASNGAPRTDSAVCELCGKRCVSKATLVYHQRTHTGEKPYECTECPKRFSIYQRLQIHRRTHTGERPFKCSHCPKAFKHKAALNRHVRVHTGAKPYACPQCEKSFSQSNSMKSHVRAVHLKLPDPYRTSKKNKA